MRWFKVHHGFTTSTKFGLIAHKLKLPRGTVLAVALEMLNHASKNSPRGSLDGLDEEEISFHLGYDAVTVSNALLALRNSSFCYGDKIANWEEYQNGVDRTNSDRQKRFREKKKQSVSESVTDSNALRNTDKIREEEIREEVNVGDKSPPLTTRVVKKNLDDPIGFSEFWGLYPKTHASRQAAVKSFNSALAKGFSHETIIEGLGQYRNFLSAVPDCPAAHPTTWLNQERWAVDYVAAAAERNRSRRAGGGKSGWTNEVEQLIAEDREARRS